MTADTEGAIVYAPEMRIAHLADDHRPKAAPVTDIEQVCWRLIDHPVHPQAGSPKVAHLVNVAWLDVATILEPTTQADGKYKVQWRINLNGARPDPIVVGTEFRAVVFSKDEDPSSETITQQHEAVISFKPASVQELMQHTDRPNSVPGRPTSMREAMELESTPGYDADNQGFFTLTLPGEIQLNKDQDAGVIAQMRNHDSKLKSGLQIESVKLIRV